MTDDQDYLLPKAMQAVAGWRDWPYPKGGAFIRDAAGHQVGFLAPYAGAHREVFVCAAKRKLHVNRYVSFMPKLVGAGIVRDRHLLLFLGTGPYSIEDAHVFNPRRVANLATQRSYVDSKRQRDVEVFDLPLEGNAVLLGDYISGRATVPGPTEALSGDTTLEQFGFEEVA